MDDDRRCVCAMMREYRNGDALRVMVQRMQEDEFADGCVGFDQVGLYTLQGEDGEVLAVFGVGSFEAGVAECYALIAQAAGKKLLEAVRFLRCEIPLFMRRRQFYRMRMTVKNDFRAGWRFAEMLGFCATVVLPRFYKENDYQLFERMEKW